MSTMDKERRILTREELRVKCHIGEGHRCCRYLVVGFGGFECVAMVAAYATNLDARVEKMTARSGPCADPYDSTSEAKPWVA